MDKMPNASGDHVTLRLDEKLSHLSHTHLECYIYRVPDRLRKQNKEAYEPEILAIGPYYHGKGSLKPMEEHKLHYLRLLVERRKERSVDRYVAAMRDLQERAFRCYSHPISLDKDEFVEMMLLDSCFIVELFRKFTITRMKGMHDPLFKMDWIHNCIWRDLLLFENQLPFFVLMQLFNMTKVPDPQDNFVDLAMRYCYSVWQHYNYSVSPGPIWFFGAANGVSTQDVKHVLGLVHTITTASLSKLISERNVGYEKKTWDYINCATELQEAGIKFKKMNHDTPFSIKFKNGTLEIPLFSVHDKTESTFRNVIAYEQHLQDDSPKYITDYLTFLCCLINSSKDVSLLRRYGILNNMLGDDEAASVVYNKAFTCVFASRDGFCYTDVFNDVNTYCRRRRNIWKANLRRNYFNSPWTIISFLGALLLLILTLAQTLLSSFLYFSRTKF